MFQDLKEFIYTEPRIPDQEKNFSKTIKLNISNESSRKEIIEEVIRTKAHSELSLLTLYIYRDMNRIDWLPFIKAAIERNPVCFTDLYDKSIAEVYTILHNLPDESIYDGPRLALPDEVWNFRRGDGIEKAILLADFLMHNDSEIPVTVEIDNHKVTVNYSGKRYNFKSQKNFKKTILIKGNFYQID
jgi:hypothetical protein